MREQVPLGWVGIDVGKAHHWICLIDEVKDLITKIRAFIDGWNDRSHPFVWTKTAEDILKKANRPTTSNARH